ncbi:hypothetical protein BS50DRAFT_624397 [Corynespora cassiicola Philippines]|uniref:Transcription factor Rba50 n=1 Tax=Corynespora cassiicola Philippines TaxID=1448308 RepID=A0A2T2NAT5_CORCC|nr:hypothetical protein BS50DRAFT_624397 [Corynespora cassiicola Philippines]
MSFAKGERVYFDLDTGTAESAGSEAQDSSQSPAPPASVSSAFIGEIVERTSSAANPPTAPSLKNVKGFPAPKKRVPRVSAFKQQRAAQANASAQTLENATPKPRSAGHDPDDERARIDQENKERLASMSADEIEQERSELLSNLPPSLLQKLLARANLDEGSNERDFGTEPPPAAPLTDDSKAEPKPSTTKKVSFATSETQESSLAPKPESVPPSATVEDSTSPNDAQEDAQLHPDQLPSSTIHFPKPSQPPDLDPDDPEFLKNLHDKYFPNMSYDPSTLSWMKPIDPSDKSSPYHPSQTALNATELRFDFRGALLAPSVAREIPSIQGLHHHAEAPEAAGYTIPELARLARSKVAAQRCMAYQTLGRILYRLGIGEFGVERRKENDGPVRVAKDPSQMEEGEDGDEEYEEEDVGSAMAAGLWSCIEEGRVIETLTEEAGRDKGHKTAIAFAQEALWNWRKGGGRQRQAV